MSDINLLRKLLTNVDKLIKFDELHIFLVVNTNEENVEDDFSKFSITTEYYSNDELSQIISSLRRLKTIVHLFREENSFIAAFINNKLFLDNALVINSAQSGTGPGRKSLIPAFCNLNNLKYSGSNAYVVSLCRNKYHVNKLLQSHNIPVPNSWLYDTEWFDDSIPTEGTKVITKPIYESASIGISNESKFDYDQSKISFIEKLSKITQQPIMVQEFVGGYEVEVPIICFETKVYTLCAVGISLNNSTYLGDNFLTYEDVFLDGYAFYDFGEFNPELSIQLLIYAKKVGRTLGINGLGRVDFRIDKDNNYFVTDVSTNPHLIKHSSYNYAFEKCGLNSHDIYKTVIVNGLGIKIQTILEDPM